MTAQQKDRNEQALKQLRELRAELKSGVQRVQAQIETLDSQILEFEMALAK
jgi:prefoldin subunit 5